MPPTFNYQGAVTFKAGRREGSPSRAISEAGDIVVVEGEPILAQSLQQSIGQWFQGMPCRVFEQGEPGLAHCLARPTALVVLDLALPDMNGRDFIRRARATVDAPILVLVDVVDWRLATELRALGAHGYVPKGIGMRPLEEALRQLLASGLQIPAGEAAPEPDQAGICRQLDVAVAVARGQSSREIAESLGLSPRTVETYRAQAMVKLRLRDTAGLVRWCVAQGLV